MNAIILFLLAALPTLGFSEEVNQLRGEYSRCVRWTTFNDVETSRKYYLTAGDSVELTTSFYEGSGICEGKLVTRKVFRNFLVVDDLGTSQIRIVKVQDLDSKLYFKFMLSPDSAIVMHMKSLDEEFDLFRTVLLDRMQ